MYKRLVWKRITSIPSSRFYEVSNTGLIRSGKTKRVLKTHITNSGYERVILGSKYKGKVLWNYVHRLVAEAFIGNIDGLEVNHKNGDKLDNKLMNLEICTRSENHKHLHRKLGWKSHNISLSKQQACQIRKRIKSGEKQYVLANEYGISPMAVSRLKRFIQYEYNCVCKMC